jgi:hypothetical protein
MKNVCLLFDLILIWIKRFLCGRKLFFCLFVGFFFLISAKEVQAQNWNCQTINDEFEGKIKACCIVGIGSSSPYYGPVFIMNKKIISENPDTIRKTDYERYREQKEPSQEPLRESINIYLSNVPYGGCASNKVKIKIDISETIFSPKVSTNPGHEEWFLEFIYEDEYNEFINLIRAGNQMTIRLSNDCLDNYTARFSLMGSSKAINYITNF